MEDILSTKSDPMSDFCNQISFKTNPDEWPSWEIEQWNITFPSDDGKIKRCLNPLGNVRKMASFAIGAIINRAVALMPDNQIYVNVGFWNGFSLFSGMIGNPTKNCLGIDNFSEPNSDPRQTQEEFLRNWNIFKPPNSGFYKGDFKIYSKEVHKGPIGVYFYDGDHSFLSQYRGLDIAKQFLAPGCLILIDDCNWPGPREATELFVEHNPEFKKIFDVKTAFNGHPTFWNGLIILRKKEENEKG